MHRLTGPMLAGVALCMSALLSNNVAARDDGRYANEPLQQLGAFAYDFEVQKTHAGDVAARPNERLTLQRTAKRMASRRF